MSRPTTPILGRPRSRSGTRSPANVADRAVCKIAGRSAIYMHYFISFPFENMVNFNEILASLFCFVKVRCKTPGMSTY